MSLLSTLRTLPADAKAQVDKALGKAGMVITSAGGLEKNLLAYLGANITELGAAFVAGAVIVGVIWAVH